MSFANSSSTIMRLVLVACLPGLIVLTWFFGWGYCINIALASGLALGFEALALRLRNHSIYRTLTDSSALVTALLLGLALPPLCPWWVTTLAVGFAILIGKHLFGGLGYNPFNPAMLGYAAVLISFPLELTTWVAPRGLLTPPDFLQTLTAVFMPGVYSLDAFTMATPLDTFKFRQGLSVAEIWTTAGGFGTWGGLGWEWVNIAFLGGGLWLIQKKVFGWHAPLGMLGALAFCALLFYDNGSSGSLGSPLMHLLTGATMMGAFFIITDPVSGATSNKGRFIFGVGVGVLVFTIRSFGGYPDAIAFAVLIMNMAAPLIDLYTRPYVYGTGGSAANRREDVEDKDE